LLVVVLGLGLVFYAVEKVSEAWVSDDTDLVGVIEGIGGVALASSYLLLAGALFVKAAIGFDPDEAAGLDGAIRQFRGGPIGQVTLIVLALGCPPFGRAGVARDA
jgi:hypothetical protein